MAQGPRPQAHRARQMAAPWAPGPRAIVVE